MHIYIEKKTQVHPVEWIYRKPNYKFLPNGPIVVETV